MDEHPGIPWHGATAADELEKLRYRRPDDDAPVREWVPWLERHAELWDRIAACDATLAANAQFVADHHRRKVKELQENYKRTDRWPDGATW